MRKKIIFTALFFVCAFAPLSLAAHREGGNARSTNNEILLDIVKDVEQLKSKIERNDQLESKVETLNNKVLENKNSWLNTLQAKLSFLVGILTIVVAVATIAVPMLSARQYRKNQEELNKILDDAKKSYNQIKDNEIGSNATLTAISNKFSGESTQFVKEFATQSGQSSNDVLDNLLAGNIYRATKEDVKKIDEILSFPMCSFEVGIRATAMKCMTEQKYERAIWFWETLGALGNKNKNELVNCYFFWGNFIVGIAKKTQNKDEAIEKFGEACKKYEKATEFNRRAYQICHNWSTAIRAQARLLPQNSEEEKKIVIKKYEEAFEKYRESTEIKEDGIEAWTKWGVALGEYALLLPKDSAEQDEAKKKSLELIGKAETIRLEREKKNK